MATYPVAPLPGLDAPADLRTAVGQDPSAVPSGMERMVTFLCFLCRRQREKTCHRRRLTCCGVVVKICEERCAEMFPLNGRMGVAQYMDFYVEIHQIVCKQKYQM